MRTSSIGGLRFGPATLIVDEYEAADVAAHPLFVTLARRPVNMQALWLFVANMNAGISPNFVRWLALAVARAPDERIACLLAKQLNDELGNGDFEHIHRRLLERFVEGLAPWRPERRGVDLLRAGRRLGLRASEVFDDGSPYEAVGGLIVSEIFAKQADQCLGKEVRRQSLVPRDALVWLDIHEVLEVDHADDSRGLAELVPNDPAALTDTWQGARALWAAMWEFLDDVQTLTFDEPAIDA